MTRNQLGIRLLLAVLGIAFGSSCMKKAGITAGPDFQKQVQEALINAKPGAVIELPEGKHDLDRTLSLSVENVTIRGKGMDKTILSFKNQKTGAAGMLVTSNGFTIEDVAIEDPKGDALKVNGANGVTIRRVRAEWTGGPNEKNGSYGMYPVQCTNVLIEDSVAIGASDAGIYVGQSKNIIVRRNRAEGNVAGIEIENSQDADVYQNTSTNNTGGLLAFNLPDLPEQRRECFLLGPLQRELSLANGTLVHVYGRQSHPGGRLRQRDSLAAERWHETYGTQNQEIIIGNGQSL